MKKIFVVAALASLVLASCTKTSSNEEFASEGTPVTFRVFTKTMLKGIVLQDFSDNVVPRDMQVSGAVFKNGTKSMDAPAFFMDRTFSEESGVWKAEPAVYYPLGSSDWYGFVAFSDSAQTNYEWESPLKVTLQVDSSSLYNDIVYAGFASKGDTLKQNATQRSLTAKFNHAQAWITMNVKAATDDITIKVESIKWNDIYTDGVFKIAYNTAVDTAAGKWNFFGLCKCYGVAMKNVKWTSPAFVASDLYGGALTTTNKTLDILYPAEQTAKSFDITYKIGNDGESMVATWNLTGDAVKEWKSGYHYTYNVTISAYEVMVAPTVNGYTEDATPATVEVK